jgi:MobC-like protein
MARKKLPGKQELKHRLYTRVNDEKYSELMSLLAKNPKNDMSRLLRDILHNRRVRVFVRDTTLDATMQELAQLRYEIRAIGVNVNQITHLFNTYPEPARKAAYAKIAFQEYLALQPKIEKVLSIMAKSAEKWLSA